MRLWRSSRATLRRPDRLSPEGKFLPADHLRWASRCQRKENSFRGEKVSPAWPGITPQPDGRRAQGKFLPLPNTLSLAASVTRHAGRFPVAQRSQGRMPL